MLAEPLKNSALLIHLSVAHEHRVDEVLERNRATLGLIAPDTATVLEMMRTGALADDGHSLSCHALTEALYTKTGGEDKVSSPTPRTH